jgi:hypothetical protein
MKRPSHSNHHSSLGCTVPPRRRRVRVRRRRMCGFVLLRLPARIFCVRDMRTRASSCAGCWCDSLRAPWILRRAAGKGSTRRGRGGRARDGGGCMGRERKCSGRAPQVAWGAGDCKHTYRLSERELRVCAHAMAMAQIRMRACGADGSACDGTALVHDCARTSFDVCDHRASVVDAQSTRRRTCAVMQAWLDGVESAAHTPIHW